MWFFRGVHFFTHFIQFQILFSPHNSSVYNATQEDSSTHSFIFTLDSFSQNPFIFTSFSYHMNTISVSWFWHDLTAGFTSHDHLKETFTYRTLHFFSPVMNHFTWFLTWFLRCDCTGIHSQESKCARCVHISHNIINLYIKSSVFSRFWSKFFSRLFQALF